MLGMVYEIAPVPAVHGTGAWTGSLRISRETGRGRARVSVHLHITQGPLSFRRACPPAAAPVPPPRRQPVGVLLPFPKLALVCCRLADVLVCGANPVDRGSVSRISYNGMQAKAWVRCGEGAIYPLSLMLCAGSPNTQPVT